MKHKCLFLFLLPCLLFAKESSLELESKELHNLFNREQHYELEAELLYLNSSLSTTFSDEHFLLNGLSPGIQIFDQAIDSIDPEYNFGYSLKFRFQVPPNRNDLALKYSYIHNDGDGALKRDVTTEAFGVTQRNIQNDTGKQHAHMHIFEFLVGRYMPLYEHIILKMLGGITVNDFHYFFRFHNRDTLITTPSGQASTTLIADISSQRKFRFWGMGPKIGGHFGYNFFPYDWNQDFLLYVSFEFTLLFSKKWARGHYGGGLQNTTSGAFSPALPLKWEEKAKFQIIPHIHVDFSARYRYTFSNDVSLSFVLGYRTMAYWELDDLNRLINYNLETFTSLPPRAESSLDTLIFSGPYGAISVGF